MRDTGGGPVPQSSAVLNVALAYALPAGDDGQARIETAYLRLCEPICQWLRAMGLVPGLGEVPGAFCDGRFNVTLGRRKLVGTAQRWRRRTADGRLVVLVHGAILLEDQREAMVEVVNRFYQGCGLGQRCQATSHVALEEWMTPAWPETTSLRHWFEAPWETWLPPSGARGACAGSDDLSGAASVPFPCRRVRCAHHVLRQACRSSPPSPLPGAHGAPYATRPEQRTQSA
ncbi:hypothetical protein D9M71_415340 [compost metagenome]